MQRFIDVGESLLNFTRIWGTGIVSQWACEGPCIMRNLESQSACKVLVVDDERVIADTLALILNKSGWSAQATYSGEDAVRLASELEPIVVISDVKMNGMSGIEAAMEIRKRCPESRIILFSGHATTTDLLKNSGIPKGTFEIIAKPLNPAYLLELLGNPPG